MVVVNDDDDDGKKLWPRGTLVTRIRDHPVDCGKNEGQKGFFFGFLGYRNLRILDLFSVYDLAQ